jgi:hypothetical protein
VISVTENSNKFQKTRFWKEKSIEDVVTLGPRAQATLIFLEDSIFSFTNFSYLKNILYLKISTFLKIILLMSKLSR